MIRARMLTCGCRKSRLLVYASSSGKAAGTSMMLMVLVIVSAVTAPRVGHWRLVTTLVVVPGVTGAPGGAPAAAAVAAADAAVAIVFVGHCRVSRSRSMGATEVARA